VRFFEKRKGGSTQQRKTSIREKKKKNKKDIKVRYRDLKPRKDAKGGVGRGAQLSGSQASKSAEVAGRVW